MTLIILVIAIVAIFLFITFYFINKQDGKSVYHGKHFSDDDVEDDNDLNEALIDEIYLSSLHHNHSVPHSNKKSSTKDFMPPYYTKTPDEIEDDPFNTDFEDDSFDDNI